ncbi:MAG: beta-ketoacyl-[acyl-carrier-protein] synthase family protein [Myxococcota bacterium]|nr:beta-ketoacyl-[acyl-carrier-protein] synthase family protein [Myxococcota bacterium]
MRRVYVTGMGVVSPIGIGCEAFWRAQLEGRSGAARVTLFDTAGLDRDVACEVKGFRARDHLTAAEARHTGRCAAFALAAAREAVAQSGLPPARLASERTATVLGTTMGEANLLGELESAWIHRGEHAIVPAKIARYGTTLLPIHVARAFGALGPVQTLPAACAAGNYAIGFAADLIRAGRVDVALCGASEIIEKLQFAGFVRLGALAPERCQPFDVDRKGLLLGEGAAMFVLESEESVVRRGATPLAEVGGYGLACDAHHITRPHPEGEGSAIAMRRAIEASGIGPDEVDFVNAHGTATPANDVIEAHVVNEVFGGRRVPVSAIKSMTGHCMGAASAIEAVSCIQSLLHGVLPPTIHLERQDPACDIDVVAHAPRPHPCRVVLNNALAFGGYDAVLCLARPGVLPPTVGEG